tara:strand:+ start:277 stop:384 length:108 start_codon:yes stop_codon:yes gene_type:complete
MIVESSEMSASGDDLLSADFWSFDRYKSFFKNLDM